MTTPKHIYKYQIISGQNGPDNIGSKKWPILSGKKLPDIIRNKKKTILSKNNPIPITF